MSDQPQASIEELAEAKLGRAGRMLVRREIRKLSGKLAEEEQLINLARGVYEGKNGLVVVTDRRVLFVEEGMVRSRIEDFPYDRVGSVQTEKSMMKGKLTIFSSGNKAVIDGVMPKERAVEIGDFVRSRLGKPTATPAPAESAPSADPAERLKKLAELRDSGVISPDEFEAQKARILSEI